MKRSIAALLLSSCSLHSQEVVLSTDYESVTPGPGALTSLTPGHSTFLSGNTINNTPAPATDPHQGILGSSILGTGQAGYVGGPLTNVTFSSAIGFFDLNTFPGTPSDAPTQLKGSSQSKRVITLDFAVERSTNTQNYIFQIFDAMGEATPNFQYHSFIYIRPNNTLFYQDNPSAPFTNLGQSIEANTPYQIKYYVDYDVAKWTVLLTNLATDETVVLISERDINVNGFTLSGWTTPESINIRAFIQNYDLTQANVFGDRMVFDNYVSGFQGKGAVEITAFSYDESADTVTFTWDSEPGETYSISYTNDLNQNFNADFVSATPSNGTTTTYGPVPSPIANATKIFFQVAQNTRP